MEQHLLTNILATQTGWKEVSGRRLLNLGGVVSSKGSLLQGPIPSWLQSLMTEISNKYQLYDGAPANHVLINSYSPGQGIMSHQDGPLYCPVVAILSLGSPAIIRFTKKRLEDTEENSINDLGSSDGCSNAVVPTLSVLLPPRSLFIFKDDAYEHYLHGIDFVEEEIIDDSVVNPTKQVVGDEKKEESEKDIRAEGDAEAAAEEKEPLPPQEQHLKVKRDGMRVSLTIRRVLRVHSLGMLRR